jgi:hypothetical protein
LTAIFNVHPGLSAWVTSHAYVVGNRVFTGSVGSGNVYQCTLGGTGTTTPSGTSTSQVLFNGVGWKWLSAYDFSSIATFSTASTATIPATLTQPIIAQCWNSAIQITPSSASTAWITLTGHTTTSTNTITITCAPGESFRDTLASPSAAILSYNSANGVTFQGFNGASMNNNYINITDANVIIDGIQFNDPNASSGSTFLNTNSGANGFILRNCLYDGQSQTSVGAAPLDFAATATVANCLFIDRQTAASGQYVIRNEAASGEAVNIVNCTFFCINGGGSSAMLNNGTSALFTRNTIAIGYTTPFWNNGATTYTVDHCLVDTASVTGQGCTDGGGNLFSKTAAATWISATNNFRLLSNSAAINAGVTDSTDIPAANDILKTSRPQSTAWDIGAYELVPATGVGAATGSSTDAAIGSSHAQAVGSASGSSSSDVAVGSSHAQAIGAATGKAVDPYLNVILSQDLTNTFWGTNGTTATSDTVLEVATNAQHSIGFFNGPSTRLAGTSTWTLSVDITPSLTRTATRLQVFDSSFGSGAQGDFGLTGSGVLSFANAFGAFTSASQTISVIGSAYRCNLTLTTDATSTGIFAQFLIQNPSGTDSYLGVVTDGLKLDNMWLARLPQAIVGSSQVNVIGSSTGTSSDLAVGSSHAQAVGSATGTGTAAAFDNPVWLGQATGTSAVAGVGASQSAAIGSTTGTSTDAAVGSSHAQAVGSSTGTSSDAAVGASQANAIGSATGSSSDAAVGSSHAQAVGSASGTGTANAVDIPVWLAQATGTSTANAVGASQKQAVASASGSSSDLAVGSATISGVGSASGTSSDVAIGSSHAAAVGSASGNGIASAFDVNAPSVTPTATGGSGDGSSTAPRYTKKQLRLLRERKARAQAKTDILEFPQPVEAVSDPNANLPKFDPAMFAAKAAPVAPVQVFSQQELDEDDEAAIIALLLVA